MACTTQSMVCASSRALPTSLQSLPGAWRRLLRGPKIHPKPFVAAASAADSQDADCNDEECAPEKEVGKVSMEWLAGEKTKIVGTFPPKKRGWTGYVEKDTAGQTNIYSVEPAIYVAESAISSGTAGTSADGSENTLAISAGLALISVAAASSILLQVSRNQPQVQTAVYSGPPLSYYINKFKPAQMVEASAAPQLQSPPLSVDAPVPQNPSTSSAVEVSEPPIDQIPSSFKSESNGNATVLQSF